MAAALPPLIAANRIDPDDPLPMLHIYRLHVENGRAASPSVVKGIKYAQLLSPEDRGLRMMTAGEYLREGNVVKARALIAPLAFDPHAPPDNPAAKLLEQIDAGQSTQARKALASERGPEAPSP